MGNIESLPESLVASYYEMMKDEATKRIRNDDDYKEKRGTGTYPHLDKL